MLLCKFGELLVRLKWLVPASALSLHLNDDLPLFVNLSTLLELFVEGFEFFVLMLEQMTVSVKLVLIFL